MGDRIAAGIALFLAACAAGFGVLVALGVIGCIIAIGWAFLSA